MKPLWENSNLETTVFPRIIAGVDYLREAIISTFAHWKSCPKYFVYFPQ